MTVASSRRLDAFDHAVMSSPYSTYSIYGAYHQWRSEAYEQVKAQSPQLSQRDDFVCSDI